MSPPDFIKHQSACVSWLAALHAYRSNTSSFNIDQTSPSSLSPNDKLPLILNGLKLMANGHHLSLTAWCPEQWKMSLNSVSFTGELQFVTCFHWYMYCQCCHYLICINITDIAPKTVPLFYVQSHTEQHRYQPSWLVWAYLFLSWPALQVSLRINGMLK